MHRVRYVDPPPSPFSPNSTPDPPSRSAASNQADKVQIWEAKSIEKSLLGRLKRFKPVGGVRYGVSH